MPPRLAKQWTLSSKRASFTSSKKNPEWLSIRPLQFILPVRSFADGYGRLAGSLSPIERTELASEVFDHVTGVLSPFGFLRVVTDDDLVANRARARGCHVIPDPGEGLSAAAQRGIRDIDTPWCVIHGDLPYLERHDIVELVAAAERGSVLCPTHDGGTSVVAAEGDFRFAYGRSSFRRHLVVASRPTTVLVRRGFALDLDTPRDLNRYRRGRLPA